MRSGTTLSMRTSSSESIASCSWLSTGAAFALPLPFFADPLDDALAASAVWIAAATSGFGQRCPVRPLSASLSASDCASGSGSSAPACESALR